MIIDAWIQHPTARFGHDRIFDSLKRWTRGSREGEAPEMPLGDTLKSMDEASVARALISLGLPAQVRELFLAGNAIRVFGLDKV